jgi:hypothetical protein
MKDGRILLDGGPRAVFRQEELLAQAGVRPPDVMRLGNRLGIDALTVSGMARSLSQVG